MFQENNSVPFGGGLLLTLLLYAGFSYFITGQIVGARTIQHHIKWLPQCEKMIESRVRANQPEPRIPSNLNCKGLLGALFGAQGQAYCQKYARQFEGLINPVQKHLNDLQTQRQSHISSAASEAKSSCQCAVSVFLEQQRLSLAVWSGSLRLIKPPQLTNLHAELKTALRSKPCNLEKRS